MKFQRLQEAQFEHDQKTGLTWITYTDQADYEDVPLSYQCWLLVEPVSDRVLATIDGPTHKRICYDVGFASRAGCKFISESGAKRYAIAEAMRILRDEKAQASESRKQRRIHKFSR